MDVRRILGLHHCYALASRVAGDVVECGVGRGSSFTALLLMAQAEGRGRHVWGFDSFQGLPAPSAEDASWKDRRQGDLRFGTPADVTRAILGSDVEAPFFAAHAHLVPGYFDDSLRHYTGERIAFLHLDVDFYQSYTTCLTTLYPRIAPGGVVAFDEYGDPTYPGARRAIDEYFGDRIGDLQVDPYLANRAFLVKPA